MTTATIDRQSTEQKTRAATQKQRALLGRLGYTGNPAELAALTMTEASAEIERLLEQQKAMIADAKDRAAGLDLIELAGRRVELRKMGAGEWGGPCPKCGGDDRFHCKADWFFCRQCYPPDNGQPHDRLGYLAWIDGKDFIEVCQELTGAVIVQTQAPPTVRRSPERKQAPAQTPEELAAWRKEARGLVGRAHAALFDSPGAEAGRAYLEGRGIDARAWLRYRLGYVPGAALPGTKGKERAPAIVIPWFEGSFSKVRAVRYRFLQAHTYTDADGKGRTEKQTALSGSRFSDWLWGGPRDDGGESGRVILICEGELNAASIWLAAYNTGLDVYSLGSESAKIPPLVVKYAQEFGRAFVWADKNAVAHELQTVIPGAYPIKSPGGKDANDLLQAGLLGGFLATIRADAAQNEEQLEGVLWDLWDAANRLQGVDRGTAAIIHKLSDKLGKPRRLVEAEPGRWIVDR